MIPNTSIASYVESVCVNPDQGRPLAFEDYEFLGIPLGDRSSLIVVQKAAQVGVTVTAILRALWFIDAKQLQTMYLFPTHRSAHRFSRGRFSVLLEQSPYLGALFREVRAAGHRRAGNVNFYCHGARSRTELMSTPVQYLTLDERDELYGGSTRQPWSAVDLARQRLSGQRDAWELHVSTPTIPGHGIAAEFAQSDQNHYHVTCPHCSRWVQPIWPDAVEFAAHSLQFTEHASDLLSANCELPTANFCCPLCRHRWSDAERRDALRHGRWMARYPGRAVRGYHLSQLLSPAATAPRLVALWLACQSHPPAKQVFYNSVLGLPLAEGARLDRRFIDDAIARGGYAMAASSQGSVMGIDVGPTWFHIVIAEPAGDFLRIVWAGKVHEWKQLPELIQRYQVRGYVIDAMPETHQVRELVRAYPQGAMCYYRGPASTPAIDVAGSVIRVPRTESLDAMYLRWRLGKVAAPEDVPAEFIEQLTTPVRIIRIGRDAQPYAEYLDSGGPDHYAHAMNYCELALLLHGPPLRFEITPPGRDGEVRL